MASCGPGRCAYCGEAPCAGFTDRTFSGVCPAATAAAEEAEPDPFFDDPPREGWDEFGDWHDADDESWMADLP